MKALQRIGLVLAIATVWTVSFAHAQAVTESTLPVLDSDAFCPIEELAAFERTGRVDLSPWIDGAPGSFFPTGHGPAALSSPTVASAPAMVFLSDPNGGAATEVILDNLIGDGTRLEGPFVRVGSDRLDGPGNVALQSAADWRFAADTTEAIHCPTDLNECPAFDAVNMYWHVDRFARDFWQDRMRVTPSFVADARVHQAGDGGFADWSTQSVKFGVGNIFMKNAALSDDLIYHEYTHLVLSSLGFEAGRGVPEQTRALHEAYADYFTATFTDDHQIGEWVVTCPPRQGCEGPVNARDLRSMVLDAEAWNWRGGAPSDTLKYGACTRFHDGDGKCKISWNNFTNPYIWGMIWGSALWSLRTELGAEDADHIILDAIRRHVPESEFDSALNDLVLAAKARGGESMAQVVRSSFEQRGFAVESTDVESGIPGSVELSMWPQPAQDRLRLSWSIVSDQAPSIRVFDGLGREHHVDAKVSGASADLDLSRMTSGWYLVVIESRLGRTARPLIISK